MTTPQQTPPQYSAEQLQRMAAYQQEMTQRQQLGQETPPVSVQPVQPEAGQPALSAENRPTVPVEAQPLTNQPVTPESSRESQSVEALSAEAKTLPEVPEPQSVALNPDALPGYLETTADAMRGDQIPDGATQLEQAVINAMDATGPNRVIN